MKKLPVLVPAAGFVIAVGCALTPRPDVPAPYYGYDPDTKACTQGTIEGSCGGNSSTQCTVSFGLNTGIIAYDNKTGSICSVPVYKPAGTTPPGGEDTPTLY
jgi:hypothetical protein